MRHIEVLSVSDDGAYLLLAPSADAERATHRVKIDDRLLAAVRGELDTGGGDRSPISPREIQARLRAGESAEEVARSARAPLPRVLRYAGPVESERERILDQARAGHVRRPRGGIAEVTLDDAVTHRLAETAGLRPDSVAWTAWRREDGAWVVELRYSARGGSRAARWLWTPTGSDLVALDTAAARMVPASPEAARPARARRPGRVSATADTVTPAPAAVGRSRPARATAARPATTPAAASPTPTPARTPRSRPAAARSKAAATVRTPTAATPTRARSSRAAPQRATRATSTTAPTRERSSRASTQAAATPTAPRPKRTPASTRAAAAGALAALAPALKPATPAKDPQRKRAVAASRSPRARRAATAVEPQQQVESSPTPSTPATSPASTSRRAGRVPVPSWSDVLFGLGAPTTGSNASTSAAQATESTSTRTRSAGDNPPAARSQATPPTAGSGRRRRS